MSRTHKDTPIQFRDPEWGYRFDYEFVDGALIQLPGKKTKKKRNHYQWWGMSTPMWWVRIMMNRPQRVQGKQWERELLKLNIEDLEDVDPPSVGRKPHWYYW